MPTIAELMGTSASMILKVYGHLDDGHLARAAERVAAGRNGGRPGPGRAAG